MPQLVCVGCQAFLRLKQAGVGVEELMPNHVGAYVPYKLWAADLYGCPRCRTEVLANFGAGPVAEHFHARPMPRPWRAGSPSRACPHP